VGFTLIELLVSSSLMAILVGMVLYLSIGVLGSWTDASDRLQAHSEARFALDTLVRDLQAAVFRGEGGVWLIVEEETAEGISDAVWLRFFTPAADRDRGTPAAPISGDLNAVGYFLRYENPINPSNPNGRVAALYRVVVDGEKTFREFQGNLENMAKDDFFSQGDPEGGESGATVAFAYLAGNVVSMKTRFYARSRTGGGEEPTFLPIDGERIEFSRDSGNPLPAYADISLIVIREDGARVLDAIANGEITGNAREDVIREFGTEFSRRVTFINNLL
jgi:prepilin-type N-terminal cleavage/methylation domain-containing protein